MAHSVPPRGSTRPTVRDEPSIGTLVKSALADVSTLVRNEVELARSELGRSVKKAGISVALFVVAGVLLALAGIYFFVAVAEAIALALPQWAAFLIVTAALAGIAGMAGLIGFRMIKKIDRPERTIESLRELPAVMRREAPGERHRDVPTVSNGHVELRGESYVV